jgi:acetylglutamate kinase
VIQFQKLGIPVEEGLKYLEEFRKAKYFAVIKVSGGCLYNHSLINDLIILYDLGLYPIVIHGAGQQIDEECKRGNIPIKKTNGIRETTEKVLNVVVETQNKVNSYLINELNGDRDIARGFHGIFKIDKKDGIHGYVGKIMGMNSSLIDECIDNKKIPIVSPLGLDKEGHWYNQNADVAACYAVRKLNPEKFIILTPSGGVYKDNKLISEMNKDELKQLIEEDAVDGGMKLKLEEIENLDHDIQITSPKNLFRELFTKKGDGSYIFFTT